MSFKYHQLSEVPSEEEECRKKKEEECEGETSSQEEESSDETNEDVIEVLSDEEFLQRDYRYLRLIRVGVSEEAARDIMENEYLLKSYIKHSGFREAFFSDLFVKLVNVGEFREILKTSYGFVGRLTYCVEKLKNPNSFLYKTLERHYGYLLWVDKKTKEFEKKHSEKNFPESCMEKFEELQKCLNDAKQYEQAKFYMEFGETLLACKNEDVKHDLHFDEFPGESTWAHGPYNFRGTGCQGRRTRLSTFFGDARDQFIMQGELPSYYHFLAEKFPVFENEKLTETIGKYKDLGSALTRKRDEQISNWENACLDMLEELRNYKQILLRFIKARIDLEWMRYFNIWKMGCFDICSCSTLSLCCPSIVITGVMLALSTAASFRGFDAVSGGVISLPIYLILVSLGSVGSVGVGACFCLALCCYNACLNSGSFANFLRDIGQFLSSKRYPSSGYYSLFIRLSENYRKIQNLITTIEDLEKQDLDKTKAAADIKIAAAELFKNPEHVRLLMKDHEGSVARMVEKMKVLLGKNQKLRKENVRLLEKVGASADFSCKDEDEVLKKGEELGDGLVM